jgi:single-stranded-DNA-specific exonuclease
MGGHPLAAGFALERKKIKTLKKAMQARAQQLLADQNLEKTLQIEAELEPVLIQIETAQLLARFAPFGLSNPKPIFVLKKALLKNYRLFGKNQEHLRLSITLTDDQKEYVVLYWRGAIACSDFKIGQFYDLAFHLDLNYYRDQEQVQLILQDYALVQ